MTYQAALEAVLSRGRFGSRLGLERMAALCTLFGHPEQKLRCVHVAGTNGKGSTAAMFAEVFSAAGLRTGLYISPYVEDFRERMQINRELIPQETFASLVERMMPVLTDYEKETGEKVTQFELETVLAFLYFAEAGCDVCVLEVGMGGRFDATNVIPPPLLSVITYIGLDHTAILGDTVEKIAFEKCGIIKTPSAVVSYGFQRPGAEQVIREICKERSCPLLLPDGKALEKVTLLPEESRFTYRGKEYRLGIPGEHIIKNALSVIEGVTYLEKFFPSLSSHLEEALARVVFGGRFEKIGEDFYIDAAHNPDCVDAMCRLLDTMFPHRPLITIMGMLRDKDHAYCISSLALRSSAFLAVTPASPRAQSAEVTREEAHVYCPSAMAAENIPDAVEKALALREKQFPGGIILALGSLYYIGEVKKALQDRDSAPSSL